MTVRNAVETIQRNFPAIKQKEILSRLDTAQKLFVRNTRCLLQWIDETGLTGAWYSLGVWMQSIIGVLFLDSNGTILDPEELEISYATIDRHLVFLDSSTGEELAAWPSNIATVRLRVRAMPSEITTIDDAFTVDETFHDAIVSKVMGDLYMLVPNTPGALDLRREHIGNWARGLIEGKRYANIGADELLDHAVPLSTYAGG